MNSINETDFPLLKTASRQTPLRDIIRFLPSELIEEEEKTQTLHAINMQWNDAIRKCTPEVYSETIVKKIVLMEKIGGAIGTDAFFDIGKDKDVRMILFPGMNTTFLSWTNFSERWCSLTIFLRQNVIMRAFMEKGDAKGWRTSALPLLGIQKMVNMDTAYVAAALLAGPAMPYNIHAGKSFTFDGEPFCNDTGRTLFTYDATAVALKYS